MTKPPPAVATDHDAARSNHGGHGNDGVCRRSNLESHFFVLVPWTARQEEAFDTLPRCSQCELIRIDTKRESAKREILCVADRRGGDDVQQQKASVVEARLFSRELERCAAGVRRGQSRPAPW